MEFVQITEKEYQKFQEKSYLKNFANSVPQIKIRQKDGWQNLEYVGVKKNGKLVAATALIAKPVAKFWFYYHTFCGALIDYSDQELLSFFVKNLKKYLHQKHALYLHFNPVITLRKLDDEGHEIEKFDSPATKNLVDLGFLHRPTTTDIPGDTENVFQYKLELSNFKNGQDLLEHVDGRTRRDINNTIKNGVKVRKLSRGELGIFKEMIDLSAERRGWKNLARTIDHYQNVFDAYGDHVEFLLSYIDSKDYIKRQKAAIKEQEELLKTWQLKPESTRREKQIRVINEMIDTLNNRIAKMNELKEKFGEEIKLSASMFVNYDNEWVYVSSGSNAEIREFNGAYAIQWDTLNRAIKAKIPIYNFYGMSGNFTKDAPDYGVLIYKTGFKGYTTENIGDFYLPVRPFLYSLYRKLKHRSW